MIVNKENKKETTGTKNNQIKLEEMLDHLKHCTWTTPTLYVDYLTLYVDYAGLQLQQEP